MDKTMSLDLYDRLLNDLQTLVQGLDLQGESGIVGNIGSNVYVQSRGEKMRLSMVYPCVLITNEGQIEEESDQGTSYETDGIVYPCGIFFYDQPTTNPSLAAPMYRQWRITTRTTLRGLIKAPTFDDCPECFALKIHNLASIPEGIPTPENVVSSLLAECWCNEATLRND
jgi:hypothetical protein